MVQEVLAGLDLTITPPGTVLVEMEVGTGTAEEMEMVAVEEGEEELEVLAELEV